jgi:hypothetical protein
MYDQEVKDAMTTSFEARHAAVMCALSAAAVATFLGMFLLPPVAHHVPNILSIL